MKLPIYFMVLLFVAVSCEGCRGHLVHFYLNLEERMMIC